MVRHFLCVKDLSKEEFKEVVFKAIDIKKNPEDYRNVLKDKTLMMIFEKPSLRTRVSFEVGMTQMGGHAIYYDIATSPMGKKESIHDTMKTASRFVDIIMARLFRHEDIEEMARTADVPVINALTNFLHPCQILCDFMTIYEKKGRFDVNITYLGDSNNNVTHSLIYGAAMMGANIKVGCPKGEDYMPQAKVIEEARKMNPDVKIEVVHDAAEAVKDADIVYTDSWMSYHITEDKKPERIRVFTPFQVTAELMKHAREDALFMNCLPAMRGYEQTAEVIDGKQSIVFDQAENRLHGQKALMLKLLGVF